MDEDLKAFLEGMETRIVSRLETRLDAQLEALESRVQERLEALEQRMQKWTQAALDDLETRIMSRMDGQLDAVEQRLQEYIGAANRELETKLIGEFWKWGRMSDARTRQALTEVGILSERMLSVEDRISALERSRN